MQGGNCPMTVTSLAQHPTGATPQKGEATLFFDQLDHYFEIFSQKKKPELTRGAPVPDGAGVVAIRWCQSRLQAQHAVQDGVLFKFSMWEALAVADLSIKPDDVHALTVS